MRAISKLKARVGEGGVRKQRKQQPVSAEHGHRRPSHSSARRYVRVAVRRAAPEDDQVAVWPQNHSSGSDWKAGPLTDTSRSE